MKRAWTVLLCIVPLARATAQSAIPIRSLAPARTVSAETFGAVLSLRELRGGHVLIDDGGWRRLVLTDSTLHSSVVVLDSASDIANAYGPRAVPLIPYPGDSSLFADLSAGSFLLLDPAGKIARVVAPPVARDLIAMNSSSSATDSHGRIIYRTPYRVVTDLPGGGQSMTNRDSALVLRADFASRTLDTLGRVRISSGGRTELERGPDGELHLKVALDPLPSVDEWVVTSTGDVALIRGHDYHIDWIHADGTRSSSPKMPFDWRRLTDADKEQLIDSARAAEANSHATAPSGSPVPISSAGGGGGGGGGVSAGAIPPGATVKTIGSEKRILSAAEMGDYYPPMRPGAAKADRDGNVWILATTSAHSEKGELIYDVVNAKGELFQRVRLPLGRSLAGFGPGGVVYLTNGSLATGFTVERTTIVK